MGTRHLIAAKIDGDLKLAQYGQWDGYPGGQGTDILAFLSDLNDERRSAFGDALRGLRWATEADLTEAQAKLDASDKPIAELLPEYSRDTSAQILDLIANRRVTVVKDDRSFAGDGPFCEWAYLIDFDRNAFEVYEGFNRGSGGFFADVERENPDYAPIGLRATFHLDALPAHDEFLAKFEDGGE